MQQFFAWIRVNRKLRWAILATGCIFLSSGIAVAALLLCNGARKDLASRWERVVPGQTSAKEIVQEFGDPPVRETVDGFDTMLYRTGNNITTQVFVALKQQEVRMVTLSGEAVRDEALTNVEAKYGPPEIDLSHNYLEGARAYIFPSRGVAAVADQNTGQVYIEQLFIPMTLSEYRLSWGKGLDWSSALHGPVS
jgi:hypothetical protein